MTASPDLESPPESPPGPRFRSPFGIGFRQPEETPADTSGEGPERTIPSPASSPEELHELAQDSEHDEMPDEPSASRDGTRSTGSSPGTKNPLAGQGLRDTFRNGVILASHQAHTFLAKTQGKLEAELYLADQQDAENIGDPLARFVGRREGLGEVSPDTADLLAAMMGLAGYATKQIQKNAIAAKIDARATAGVQPEPVDL